MVDQDVMKGPNSLEDTRKTSSDRESKFARVKRMLTCQTRTPITYDEAKASAKARKRKERQESISSISQERKVIRSNSEERAINQPADNNKEIRRVSSQEDFKHLQPLQAHNDNVATLAIQDGPMKITPQREIVVDDSEFERRRSHERFSRPLVQRGRYSQPRKPKSKQFPKTHASKEKSGGKKVKHDTVAAEDEDTVGTGAVDAANGGEACNFLQLHQKEKERSPSPVHTPISPALDLSTLHEQIDNAEPILSNIADESSENQPSLSVPSNRLLSSPRNSVIITQRIYLNPDVPLHPSLKDSSSPFEHRQRHIAKQINSLKKKIKRFDDEFETKHGYRPSHADKLNDKHIKKLCAELNKLKKEQKTLQEDLTPTTPATVGQEAKKLTVQLKETLQDIEKRLDAKRSSVNRSHNLEELSNDELVDEKVAVQKALLYLESVHGRPSNKEDKDLARPLYDRYRQLKRSLTRMNTISNVIELATIHEHETMDFVSLPTQIVETESEKLTLTGSTTDSDTDTSIGENLHALSLEELIGQQKNTSEEKKHLRRSLKEFETEFEVKTGRKLQKEDRASMESVYTSYKRAKAKLKLLDALVGKQAL